VELQGVCVPRLQAAGYWKGNSAFVLVTDFLAGAQPLEDSLSSRASSSMAAQAEEVGLPAA
jgi:hypothetical protein